MENTPDTPQAPLNDEEQIAKEVSLAFHEGAPYIDRSPEHQAALNLIEERKIQRFDLRQKLFRTLNKLTNPPEKSKPVIQGTEGPPPKS